MGKIDFVTAFLVFAGFLVHFLLSWGEYWRSNGHMNPYTFATLELPKWLAALLSCIISYFTLPQLGPLLGFGPPLGAVLAGYGASSMGGKLANLTNKNA